MKRPRAFTLFEIILSMGILALLAGAIMVQWRGGVGGADTRGLAEAVGEVMRMARSRAIATQSPVGVCLPSLPYARSLKLLEGLDQGRPTRIFNFAGDHPGAVIFHGQWNLDSSQLRDPGSTNQTGSPLLGGRADRFDPAAWLAANADATLIFTPSGQVKGRGLTYFDQDYHFVVSEGVTASGNQLTGVYKPYTVSVSATGTVSVSPGVTAGPSVAQSGAALGSDPLAAPSLPGAGANSAPHIARINMHPNPNPQTLPGGADVLLAPGDALTLEVEATDADGDALSVTWTGDPSLGAFSCNGAEPMEWDPKASVWRATVTWRPLDPNPTVATRFNLECKVEDRRGGVALSSEVGQRTVAIGENRPMLITRFTGLGPGWGETYTWGGWASLPAGAQVHLYTANLDGSAERCVTDKARFPEFPLLSPDGKRISYIDIGANPWELHVINSDGTQDRAILPGVLHPSPADFSAAWSPDGAYIAITDGAPSDGSRGERIVVVNADTPDINSAVAYSSAPGNLTRLPAWSPDASHLIFCAGKSASEPYQIYQIDFTQPTPRTLTRLTNGPTWDTRPAFSPDGSHIAFGFGNGQWNIGIIKADGSDRHTVYTSAARSTTSGCWSPDGKFLCCRDDANILVIPLDANYLTTGSPVPVTNNPPNTMNLCYAISWTSVNNSATPSDNRVVFSQGTDGRYSLFSVKPDGSELVRFTNTTTANDLSNGLCGPQHSWW